MRVSELTNQSNIIGPLKLLSIEKNRLNVEGHTPIILSADIKEKLTPGYNYAFELEGNTATKVILMTVDIVVYTEDSILLIKRKSNPFAQHWALPGGFVDAGETAKEAALRELEEETGVVVNNAKFVGKFDMPNRDPRMANTWSFAYKLKVNQQYNARAGDDANAAAWVPIDKLPKILLAFDHKDIIEKALNT